VSVWHARPMMKPTDARLASLHDVDNPDGPDHDQWRRLAQELAPDAVVDLGCGPRILTVTLTPPHRTVVGVDPDAGMLDPARPEISAMTTGPSLWFDIAAGLRLGGTLGFETRNPATESDELGTVVIRAHNQFEGDLDEIVITQRLAFRSLQKLQEHLAAAGCCMGSLLDRSRQRQTSAQPATRSSRLACRFKGWVLSVPGQMSVGMSALGFPSFGVEVLAEPVPCSAGVFGVGVVGSELCDVQRDLAQVPPEPIELD